MPTKFAMHTVMAAQVAAIVLALYVILSPRGPKTP